MRSYRAVFNRQALKFVAATDEDTFAEIEWWVNKIEREPSLAGDYTEQDEDHRKLHIIVLSRGTIAYWPDHAVREVRVARIEENR